MNSPRSLHCCKGERAFTRVKNVANKNNLEIQSATTADIATYNFGWDLMLVCSSHKVGRSA